jgi:hypothetical protein
LHVLGLPPAFALSQDQTLKLDENFTRLITTFDEVPLLCARDEGEHDLRLTRSTSARSRGVDLKRRPPKSRPTVICVETDLRTSQSQRDRGPR